MNKRILRAHLDITGKCNSNCKHCHMSDFYKKEFTKKEIFEILTKLKREKINRIALSGGEPFLRKDIFEILKKCPKEISLLTNALLIDDLKLTKLKKLEKENGKKIIFRISLDGLSSNKRLRGYSYKTILEKIKKIRKNNFIVVINTTASPFIKKNELISMLKILEKIKVDQWNIDLPFKEGNYKTFKLKLNEDFILKEIKKVIKDYLKKDYKIRLDIVGLFCSEWIKKRKILPKCDINTNPCDYQFNSITINPKGDILLCPSLHTSFGNIFKDKLSEYRKSKKWINFANKKRDYPKGCKNCKFIKICGGGCRANAYSNTGKIWEKDLLSCKLMKFLEKELIKIYPKKVQEQFKELIS
jgi:radical SAM protein with 4Fe4S-binding SPASM domain